jgi:drug/metabolite transporter (DMT)-like permease
MSVPILWGILLATGRRMSWSILRYTALPGMFYGINMTMVFASVRHASVAVVTVIFALQPGIVLLLASRWMGEKATLWHIAWTLVGIGGVVALVMSADPQVRGNALGVVLAVIGMLSFTGFTLLSRHVRSTVEIDPIQFIAGATLFACLTVTPVALVLSSTSDFRQIAGMDWAYLLFVGVVVGVGGHTLMSWATKFVPASRSSLVLLGVNVVSVLAAWPLHHEPITGRELISGVIVLGAVAAVISRPAGTRLVEAQDLGTPGT